MPPSFAAIHQQAWVPSTWARVLNGKLLFDGPAKEVINKAISNAQLNSAAAITDEEKAWYVRFILA